MQTVYKDVAANRIPYVRYRGVRFDPVYIAQWLRARTVRQILLCCLKRLMHSAFVRLVAKSKHELGWRHQSDDGPPIRPPHGWDAPDADLVPIFDEGVDRRSDRSVPR